MLTWPPIVSRKLKQCHDKTYKTLKTHRDVGVNKRIFSTTAGAAMSDNRAAIARAIDKLDHPDATLQDEILDGFSQRADTVRPVVLANLPVVNARVRRALLRWLKSQLNAEATLPLMRYVFDEQGTIAEQSGRSLAMTLLRRRARATESPEERGRLRAFAEDICGDEDPEIRRQALEILGYVGNIRSIHLVERCQADADPEVQRAAKRTLVALAEAPDDEAASPRPAPRLIKQLLNSAGPRRRQLLHRWRRHDQRAAIAIGLLRNRAELRREALQILLEEPTPEARPFLASIILDDPDGELSPLALRLLAKVADGESPGPDEVEAIRRAFRSSVLLSQAASCAAIGALKLTQFAPSLVDLSSSGQLALAMEAAKALDRLVEESHFELVEEVCESVRINERRRRQDPGERDRVELIAHLLSALRTIVDPNTVGVESVHRTAFEVLSTGARERPLRITGIDLLMASTPTEGLDRFDRWDEHRASTLVGLLPIAERPAIKRIGTLLYRGAPQGWSGLDKAARTLWKTGYVDLAEVIVPLLCRSESEKALQWLQEIADGDDAASARMARDFLRRRRNSQDIIDAEYISPDE